ncbi:unnamed protein product [Rotaria sp. Silwood2]|nr:unnamed protein product [Rotaria sp. Silwood2]
MAGSVRSGRELLEVGQLLPGHLLTGAECQPCDQLIKQTCLSHGTEREVLCTNETGGTKTFTCGEPCGKLLSCDHHKCTKTCHDGPCPSCKAMKYDPIKNPFRCKQLCKKEKSCRKHRCNRICCNLDSHQCELVCGKILNCGIQYVFDIK